MFINERKASPKSRELHYASLKPLTGSVSDGRLADDLRT